MRPYRIPYRCRLVYLLSRLFLAQHGCAGALRSRVRPDRSGAQIHDDLMAASFCFHRGIVWGGSVGGDHYREHLALSRLLGLAEPRRRGCWSLLPAYYRERVLKLGESQIESLENGGISVLSQLLRLDLPSSRDSLRAASIFSPAFLAKIRADCPLGPASYTGRRIVIHIRRGDISSSSHPHRYTPNTFYLHILDALQVCLGDGLDVTIHSQSSSSESFTPFQERGAKLKLDGPIEEAWADMITADILVLSKSSFSYVPALYNPNIVLYQPFWHAALPNWISLASADWNEQLASLHAKLKESCSP